MAAAPLVLTANQPAAAVEGDEFGGIFVPAQGRLLDTRPAYTTGGYTTPMPAGVWRSVEVADRYGIPTAGVSAVVVALTVITPTTVGRIHASPDGATPSAQVGYLDYMAGPLQTNTATLKLGSNGDIQLMATTSVNLTVDVQGYYTAGAAGAGGFVPVTPTRMVDTRYGIGLPAVALTAGSTSLIQATGHAGIPADATSIVVNFTVLNPTAQGYITPFAADQPDPMTALTFGNFSSTAIGAIVPLSTSGPTAGAFKVHILGTGAQLIVDVVGYSTLAEEGIGYFSNPAHVLDTRESPATELAAYDTLSVPIAGVGGIPLTGASAVNLHVTVISPGGGYVSAWPSLTTEPQTNAVSYRAASIVSNFVTTAVGTNGEVNIRNHGPNAVHLVVDIEGWYGTALARYTAIFDEDSDAARTSLLLEADSLGVPAETLAADALAEISQANADAGALAVGSLTSRPVDPNPQGDPDPDPAPAPGGLGDPEPSGRVTSSGDDGLVPAVAAAYPGDFFYYPSSSWGINHGHVGIYRWKSVIVEAANSNLGVNRIHISDRKFKEDKTYIFYVDTSFAAQRAAADWSQTKVDQDYRPWYNTRNKYTHGPWNCSQLLWAAYGSQEIWLDSNGGNYVWPADIVNHSKTLPYKKV